MAREFFRSRNGGLASVLFKSVIHNGNCNGHELFRPRKLGANCHQTFMVTRRSARTKFDMSDFHAYRSDTRTKNTGLLTSFRKIRLHFIAWLF